MKKKIMLLFLMTMVIGFQCSNPVEPLLEAGEFKGLTQQERLQIKTLVSKMNGIWQDQFHLRKGKEFINKTTIDDLLMQYKKTIGGKE